MNSLTLADYCLRKAKGDHIPLTAQKLNKLVVLAHGWHLVFTSGALVSDAVELWAYGPIVPSLYHATQHWGRQPIQPSVGDELAPAVLPWPCKRSQGIVDFVWRQYSHFNGVELSNFVDGLFANNALPRSKSSVIPNHIIKKAFQLALTEHQAKTRRGA